jgi:hypothetical protein
LLEVITCGDIPVFEEFVEDWLTTCGNCDPAVQVENCVTDCEPIYDFPTLTYPNFKPDTLEVCD